MSVADSSSAIGLEQVAEPRGQKESYKSSLRDGSRLLTERTRRA